MKRIFAFIIISLPFLASAQMEIYGRYTTCGTIVPNINYFGAKNVTEKISLTFFGLVEPKWSEALIGLKYSPTNSFSIGASAGIETGTNFPRFGAGIFTIKDRISLLVLGELGCGKDNYMYKTNLFYQSSGTFTFGATAWRFHGVGPNFRYMIAKLSLTIWLMPAYDFEAGISKLIIGAIVNM